MEASGYVETTLKIYRNVLADFSNAGICLQAYLHRTRSDVESLLLLKPSIRLVKGAYSEPPNVALGDKHAIDNQYFQLAQNLLGAQASGNVRRAAFATHDPRLIHKITEFAAGEGLSREQVEVQMLYGIQRTEQERLANGGWRSGVLIAYGSYWYPWFVRRLAERPANLWLLLRNLVSD
jgi:proline dehydrogenase